MTGCPSVLVALTRSERWRENVATGNDPIRWTQSRCCEFIPEFAACSQPLSRDIEWWAGSACRYSQWEFKRLHAFSIHGRSSDLLKISLSRWRSSSHYREMILHNMLLTTSTLRNVRKFLYSRSRMPRLEVTLQETISRTSIAKNLKILCDMSQVCG